MSQIVQVCSVHALRSIDTIGHDKRRAGRKHGPQLSERSMEPVPRYTPASTPFAQTHGLSCASHPANSIARTADLFKIRNLSTRPYGALCSAIAPWRLCRATPRPPRPIAPSFLPIRTPKKISQLEFQNSEPRNLTYGAPGSAITPWSLTHARQQP